MEAAEAWRHCDAPLLLRPASERPWGDSAEPSAPLASSSWHLVPACTPLESGPLSKRMHKYTAQQQPRLPPVNSKAGICNRVVGQGTEPVFQEQAIREPVVRGNNMYIAMQQHLLNLTPASMAKRGV